MSILGFFDSNGQNQSGAGDMTGPNKSESALSRFFWLLITAAIFLSASYVVEVYLVRTPSKIDAMQKQINDLRGEMNNRFDNMRWEMDSRFNNMQGKIDGLQREMSERMQGFDSQLSSVNSRLDTLNDNINRTNTNIDREIDEIRALLAHVSTTPAEQ